MSAYIFAVETEGHFFSSNSHFINNLNYRLSTVIDDVPLWLIMLADHCVGLSMFKEMYIFSIFRAFTTSCEGGIIRLTSKL